MGEIKFSYGSEEACPEVKQVLEYIAFTDLKDLDKTPSFDIAAKFELENEKEGTKTREITYKILEKI